MTYRSEWCVVDAFEFPISVKLRDAVENIEVGLVGGSDNELRCLSDCASCWSTFKFVDPLHRCQDVALVVLHLGEFVHVVDGSSFEVYGESGTE